MLVSDMIAGPKANQPHFLEGVMPAPSERREPGILCDESTAGTTAWYAIASLLTQALDKEGHTVC